MLDGNTVMYAAFKNHIGPYPSPETINAFAKDISNYETAGGPLNSNWTERYLINCRKNHKIPVQKIITGFKLF